VSRNVNRNVNRNNNWNGRRVERQHVHVPARLGQAGLGRLPALEPAGMALVHPVLGWWGAGRPTWGVGDPGPQRSSTMPSITPSSSNQTYIVVPNSDYQLLYGNVQPSGNRCGQLSR